MERWALIYNPIAGGFRPERLEALVAALAEAGIAADALACEAEGHASELARTVRNVARVAVYGGDGTQREVAQGLLGRDLPLVYLPGGSANSIAGELGMPKTPLPALQTMLRGRVARLHPGTVDGHCFLTMAGFGFDALAIHLLSRRMKNRLGSLAYILTGFRCLVHRHPTFRVSAGGREHRALWAVAARAQRYAGVLRIHPRAALTNDALGLVAVNGWMLVPFGIGRLLLHLPVRGPGLALEDHRAVRIHADEPIHAHLDGDWYKQGTDFEIGIEERAVLFTWPG